jgi:KAP family P-loop domain
LDQDLCEKTTVPANVALFGAWGSGKSSLANLLELEFARDGHKAVAFARFDAFKYAEIPLRRHLLTQVANQFAIDGDQYGAELYRSKKTNTFHLPFRKLAEFAVLLGVVASGVVLLLAVIAAVVGLITALAPKGSFFPAFTNALQGGIPGVVISSGLLAALLALAGRTFTVESTQAPPSTEEEFDRLFRKLVGEITRRTKCERIVIFVDELDRCSPGQVVTVLETIKTFLDIPPCVFLVAADQQVVEYALRQKSRQATPGDSVNPYYSAGSAYLDKIFQHQVSLPPLLSRTLSQFALDLIESRPGVWQQIKNKPELVTVLVPSHVRSPRRVKVLLNGFVLAYRLALRRSADGALDSAVDMRVSEMAKLVCLRTEFPLFAADLRIDARMPQAVLALADDPELMLDGLKVPGFSEEAFGRAKAYASGRLPVDEVIVHSPDDDANDARLEELAELEDPSEEGTDDEEPEAPAGYSGIVRSQGRQLVAYLRRTRQIPGPGRDLVFLESSGAAVGLPAELADELEQNALNGATEAVIGAIIDLDSDQQAATVRLLCYLARETFGVEAENICHCLLEALRAGDIELDAVVDDLLTTLQALTSAYELQPDDLPGAFEISLLRATPAAFELRRRVLAREETRTDAELGVLVLSRAHQLRDPERRLLGPVLAARFVGSPPDAIFRAIDDLDDSTIVRLIGLEEEDIRLEIMVDGDEPAVAKVKELAKYAVANRPAVAPPLVRLLLSLDSTGARTAAEPLLGEIAPITDPGLVRAVLEATQQRSRGWDEWLDPLEPTAVEQLDEAPKLFGTLGAGLIGRRFATEQPMNDDQSTRALNALERTRPKADIPSEQIETTFNELAASPAVNDEQCKARLPLHRLTNALAEASLLSAETASRLILTDITKTLSQPREAISDAEQLSRAACSPAQISR